MILALTFVSMLLLWQASEDVTAPQINIEPNHDALTTVLNVPSANVSGTATLADRDLGHIYQVGGSVTPPRIKYQIQPNYEKEARKAKKEGMVVIKGVVGTDGKLHDAHVIRRLGMGLDEKALEAVKQWVFEPATMDGRKVAVYVEIAINFKLF